MKFFKKKSLQKNLSISNDNNKKSTVISERVLRNVLKKCPDIQFSSTTYIHHQITYIYCSGLVNTEILYNTVPQSIDHFFFVHKGEITEEQIRNYLHIPTLDVIDNLEVAITDIFAGKLLIDFGINGKLFTIDISERPQRKPEETATETTVKGPRDNFIEDINVNISLIRKRLRTSSLAFEQTTIGKRSQTKVAILYMDDIANMNVLKEIKNRLSTIDIDGLVTTQQLEETFNNTPYAVFPRHQYTGKPDFAVQTLLNGRFVILIDGVTIALITPINFFLLLKGSEDKEVSYIFSSFQRLIRISGLFLSAILPGIWVSLTSFHQDQLPISLLATVVESRKGVPLPVSIEVILMILLFELFKEAGLRLPMSIGQILSVVGGLIIGDAAISAGLASPVTVVVIALSTLSTFNLNDQSLIGTLSLTRLFIIIFSSLFGFFGMFTAIFVICAYIGRINTFGVSYLEGISLLNISDFIRTIIKIPSTKYTKRPKALELNDVTRTGEENENKKKS